jgi:demethylmenaquinone methyltransferase/2-methoxy-6-polyprenyl-1,4-benzoquinol methylase
LASVLNHKAELLFTPIAGSYERWARILSLGQDSRWRQAMVNGLEVPVGALTLDVAAGTGSISRLLDDRDCTVIAVDLSAQMLAQHGGERRVRARAEQLPFPEGTFDVLTFGYLLRYVDDPVSGLTELVRVVRPGGMLGMVEFGLPQGFWHRAWRLYTGVLLPLAGLLAGPGWHEVSRFLRHSIEEFHGRHPLSPMWEAAGLVDVRACRMSLGGGLVMWGQKP